MQFIVAADLAEFTDTPEARLDAMIEDVMADATRIAPCLATVETTLKGQGDQLMLVIAQVRSILRAALLRWAEAGSGAYTQHSQTTGPFTDSVSIDTRQRRSGMFWPSEIKALQDICKSITGSDSTPRAFNVDQVAPTTYANHQPWCSVTWGGWCSCGANLTRGEYPLWEGGALS